jgi:hypothetical protein
MRWLPGWLRREIGAFRDDVSDVRADAKQVRRWFRNGGVASVTWWLVVSVIWLALTMLAYVALHLHEVRFLAASIAAVALVRVGLRALKRPEGR